MQHRTKEFLTAVQQGELAKVKTLLQESPDLIDTVDKITGDTVLHVAAWAGRVEIVALVIATAKSLACAQNMAGNTPLHYANRAGHQAVAQIDRGNPRRRRHSESCRPNAWRGNSLVLRAAGRGAGTTSDAINESVKCDYGIHCYCRPAL